MELYPPRQPWPVLKNKKFMFASIQSRGERWFKNAEIFSAPTIRTQLSHSLSLSCASIFTKLSASWARSSTRKIPDRKRGVRPVSTFCTSRISSRCFNIPLTQWRQVVSAGVFALKILKRAEGGVEKNTQWHTHARVHTQIYLHAYTKRWRARRAEPYINGCAKRVRIPRD